MEETFGQTNTAEIETRAEAVGDQLGRAAADVEDERARLELAPAGDAAARELPLLLTGEQAGREAVAPLDLAEECLAVLGVADRAGADGERPLGA